MKGFIELSVHEQVAIEGGKDSSAAKTIELIGYLIGSLVRIIKDGRGNVAPKVGLKYPFFW